MALQNSYKAVIVCNGPDGAYDNLVVVGRARSVEEVVRRIQDKFGIPMGCKCWIKSIEYLGWETF